MEEPVLFTKQEHVGLLTLNRAQVRNALSYNTLVKINELLEKLEQDQKLRALIITGSGAEAFCAGADLKERKGMSVEESLRFVTLIQRTCHRISLLPMPTIAALNGDAFGGGLELALACDMRLSSMKTRLGLTECSLGIIPGAGGTQRLPRIVGFARASELIFMAARLSASRALGLGLLNALAEEGQDVLELAQTWASRIAKQAPLAVRAAKRAMLEPARLAIENGLIAELSAYESIICTKDRQEGLNAFMEKRSPCYEGR